MPLIVLTGLPCSGKTHRAQQIAAALTSYIQSDPSLSKRKVRVISSQHASLDEPYVSNESNQSLLRDQIYNSTAQEKTARAEEFSTVKRAVSKDVIVIADDLNYIKGYRYQLWCEAKAAGTRSCVVHVAAQEDECEQWNLERLKVWGRDADVDKVSKAQTVPPLGGRVGRDVLGDLTPESHTAIYGDRVVEKRPVSPSSSLDNEDGNERAERQKPEDTMTLKSLYIHNGSVSSMIPTSMQPSEPVESNFSTWTSISATVSTTPPTSSSAPPYSPTTYKALTMRYEPPSPFSRWDTPLFTIPTNDSHPPYEQIWNAMYPPPAKPSAKKLSHLPAPTLTKISENGATNSSTAISGAEETVKQHAATILPKATSGDALQILESATMAITKILLSRARELGIADTGEGGTITFAIPSSNTSVGQVTINQPKTPAQQSGEEEDESETQYEITLPQGMILSQPVLQRLRRKYTQMQRGSIAHGQGHVGERGRKGVEEGFVRFLAAEWEG